MSYTSWHVGMKVVCVNARGKLVNGNIYTIRALDEKYVYLQERTAPYEDEDSAGWLYSRFRPVQERKTSIAIFTAMLHDNKEHVQ